MQLCKAGRTVEWRRQAIRHVSPLAKAYLSQVPSRIIAERDSADGRSPHRAKPPFAMGYDVSSIERNSDVVDMGGGVEWRRLHEHFLSMSQSLLQRRLSDSVTCSEAEETHPTLYFDEVEKLVPSERPAEPQTLDEVATQSPLSSILHDEIPRRPRLWSRDDITVVGKREFESQLRLEEHVIDEAMARYQGYIENMTNLGMASSVSGLQNLVRGWYFAVRAQIEADQRRVWENRAGPMSKIYGPLLVLLQPEKLAVIVLHEVLSSCLECGNQGVPITKLCVKVADAAQSEVNLLKVKKRLGGSALKTLSGSARAHVRKVNIRAKRALDVLEFTDWSTQLKVQLGAALIRSLCNSVKMKENEKSEKVFIHSIRRVHNTKTVGICSLSKEAYKKVNSLNAMGAMEVRFPPMVVPPRLWERHDRGAYYRLKSKIMRCKQCVAQVKALKIADLRRVLHTVNCLGALPWKINEEVYKVIKKAWEENLKIGSIPPQQNIPEPPQPRKIKKWLTKKGIEKFVLNPNWSKYVNKKRAHQRVVQQNADRHSLRSDFRLKLDIMDRFAGKIIFFPHNLDFRGRAYPMPPHLNHMGDDLCRGVLRFAEARPLGPRGLYWLKVQACSLYGNDKWSFDARRDFADANIDLIRGCVEDPLGPMGEWWRKADEPFQCLATCRELIAAIDSADPENFMSTLPIHQDGSCNGLQHYAALGRDYFGGEQVNLLPGDAPRDVYSSVCERVNRELAHLRAIPGFGRGHLFAELLSGMVERKVVKQTVMTSVYGVTFYGAQRQIQSQLEERMSDEYIRRYSADGDPEELMKDCSKFLAKLTLQSLQGLFSEAKAIMDWLGQLAGIVAGQGQPMSWVTPLGLPVVQPYRQDTECVVNTVLQKITLNADSDRLPVAGRRQRSAFPPNFIHSLDSTHMLMTAHAMDRAGLPFAAVHDSYWCHAGHVDEMSGILRAAFVELYSQPVLEDLHRSLCLRYPSVEFPPVPDRGSLDLRQVMNSRYFFN